MGKSIENFKYEALPSDIDGLKWIPTLGEEMDALDSHPPFGVGYSVPREFSDRDQEKLLHHLQRLLSPKCIVEIGVNRNPYDLSSTKVLVENKPAGSVYIGIDIADKSNLNDPLNGVHTILGDSQNRDLLWEKMDSLGLKEIDFLFIDGYHSVDVVLNDWKYTERLAPNGIVGFHDTNTHPGPYFVFDAVDEELYKKDKYFFERTDDWGIAFAQKR